MRSTMLPLLLMCGIDWNSVWVDEQKNQVTSAWEVVLDEAIKVIEESRTQELSTSIVEKPLPSGKRRILFFTAKGCNPCLVLKEKSFKWLSDSDWVISEFERSHIQIVDWDSNPDLVNKYQINRVPTLVLIDDNVELRRVVGPSNRHAFVNLYNGMP